MNNNPGRVVSVFQISKVFGEVYLKGAVPLNIIKVFQKCGIMPMNPDVFTDVDFVAANTKNQEKYDESVEITPSINAVPVEDVENNLATDPFINSNPDTVPVPPVESVDNISPSRAAVLQPFSSSSSPSVLSICENEIVAITPPRDKPSPTVALEFLSLQTD
ncbi:unnamed protein product [Euphydryas editha]|uniref:Uncharacterized protein n=1 Tax=Euphydryas editha TaxID=104508 RepID=A0AAU9US75_EUPED|nr:unnamed protein product [Euphydryas editha]